MKKFLILREDLSKTIYLSPEKNYDRLLKKKKVRKSK